MSRKRPHASRPFLTSSRTRTRTWSPKGPQAVTNKRVEFGPSTSKPSSFLWQRKGKQILQGSICVQCSETAWIFLSTWAHFFLYTIEFLLNERISYSFQVEKKSYFRRVINKSPQLRNICMFQYSWLSPRYSSKYIWTFSTSIANDELLFISLTDFVRGSMQHQYVLSNFVRLISMFLWLWII